MDDNGFFGGLFDLDGDGKLDDFERALDFSEFMELMEEEEMEDTEDIVLSDADDLDDEEFFEIDDD